VEVLDLTNFTTTEVLDCKGKDVNFSEASGTERTIYLIIDPPGPNCINPPGLKCGDPQCNVCVHDLYVAFHN
jgi:hypothetical protein